MFVDLTLSFQGTSHLQATFIHLTVQFAKKDLPDANRSVLRNAAIEVIQFSSGTLLSLFCGLQ